MNKTDLTKELGENFIGYAAAFNTDRAIPDAYCGLKPVARRILYDAYYNGRTSSKPYVKCARITGEVMGQLHPHGDSSIYDAMTRLAQDWVMRYPLIDFHGNVGNIMGDGQAAMRYTEARLTKLSEQGLLCGINKNNVDFVPNYDETMEEPVTLPSIFPNLLCNPNNGIGIAIACNWPANNLNEVAQAIYDYMDGKEPTIPGPDFPTGGVVIDKDKIPNILKTGRGTIRLRGKYKIEKNEIIFYEIPYGTTIEGLLDQIGKCADDGNLVGISDAHDESNKKGIRLVIEVDKNSNIANVLNELFQKTDLQTSFSYNQVALVNKTPTELNFKDCIKIYIEHNLRCLEREAQFDLNKAEARKEIVEGLLKALENIDNIIAIIKKSSSSADAKINLMQKYAFTEPQAKAIVSMRLGSLANLEKVEIQNEHKELIKTIESLKEYLTSEDEQKTDLRKRLAAIVSKFGDKRRTEIIQLDTKNEKVSTITPEKVVVTLSKEGLIKRLSPKARKVDTSIISTIRTNTVDTLMVFTNLGQMYKISVNDLPEGAEISVQGMHAGEYPTAIYSLSSNTDSKYVLFVTKNGLVKKTSLDEYTTAKRKSGIAAIKLKEDDNLANVCLINDEPIVIVTHEGMGIKFDSSEIATTSRATSGIKGIALKNGDYVVEGLPIRDTNDDLAIFTVEGKGKRIKLSELPTQRRAGKGVVVGKNVVNAAMVDDSDTLLLLGSRKSARISAKDLPSLGRQAIGNIMIKDTLQSISKV